MRTAAIVGALAFLAYWSTLQAPLSGDATTHLYLAHSFLVDGDADLSEFAAATGPFVFNFRDAPGGLYSVYFPGNALLFTPFELAALAFGVAPMSIAQVAVLAKLASSLAVAASVALLYLTLRRVARERVALFLTFTYSFASAAFGEASQRYLQHGPTLLLLSATLYLLVRGEGARTGGASSGLFVALGVLVRPQTVLVGLAIAAFLAHRRRAALPRFLFWALGPLAFLFIYDARVFGSPLRIPGDPFPFGSPLSGILGLLISPSRGLLVYGPFLVVALAALAASWRWPASDRVWLLRYGSLAALSTILLFGWYADWIGGWGYGNRYLNDLLPLDLFAIAVAWERWLGRAWARGLFAVAVGWGLLLEAAGAGLYYFTWNGRHWDSTPDIAATPERVWSWTEAQWQWVFARLILDPPPAIAIEAVVVVICITVYVVLARRSDPERYPSDRDKQRVRSEATKVPLETARSTPAGS